jgi:hypothetical protein
MTLSFMTKDQSKEDLWGIKNPWPLVLKSDV